MMLKHRSRLQAALARIKVKRKVSRNQDLLPLSVQHNNGVLHLSHDWPDLITLSLINTAESVVYCSVIP